MKNQSFWIAAIILASIFLIVACSQDDSLMDPPTSYDNIIDLKLSQLETPLSREDFVMPTGPNYFNDLPQHPNNPLTAAKIELGKNIFWDPVFAQNVFDSTNSMEHSCGTCHIAEGHSGLNQGIAEGGVGTGLEGIGRIQDEDFVNNPMFGIGSIDGQPVRVPTQVNATYKPNVLWNGMLGGRGNNVINGMVLPNQPNDFPHDLSKEFMMDGPETQSLAGLSVHRMKFNEQIITDAGYKAAFDAAFNPADLTLTFSNTKFVTSDGMFLDRNIKDIDNNNSLQPDDPIVDRVPIQYSRLAAALALSAYVRSTVTNDAPFQRFVRREANSQFTDEMKRGFITFMDLGCLNCHNGPALTDGEFHALGTNDLVENYPNLNGRFGNPLGGPAAVTDERDKGRFAITGEDIHYGAFLTPTLYNIHNEFIFHGSKMGGIEAAVDYKLAGIPEVEDENIVRAIQLEGLFGPAERELTGDEKDDLITFLRDGLKHPNFNEDYRPNSVLSGLCSPNNDNVSVNTPGGSVSLLGCQ